MKTTKKKTVIVSKISPIFEKILKDEGCGILGFTVIYPEDKFENIICPFILKNRTAALIEIEHKRQVFLNDLNKANPIISTDKHSINIKPRKGVSNE